MLALKVVFGKLLPVPKLCKKILAQWTSVMTGTVCFEQKKTTICNAKFGDLGIMGQEVRICCQKCHIWNRRPWFSYSLCNFRGATMMIKGSLLLSAPLLSIFDRKKLSPVLGQNLPVWGINKGLKLNLSFITPKRHILAWFHVFWAIAHKNPSTGLTCTRVWEKKV